MNTCQTGLSCRLSLARLACFQDAKLQINCSVLSYAFSGQHVDVLLVLSIIDYYLYGSIILQSWCKI